MRKFLISILMILAASRVSPCQTISAENYFVGKTMYINGSLWKMVEPMAFHRGKLTKVSNIENDTILQKNYLEKNTWFKFLEIAEVDGKEYFKIETNKRYYYLPTYNCYNYMQHVREIGSESEIISAEECTGQINTEILNDDLLIGHNVFFGSEMWKSVTPYSISQGRLKLVSEISNDDIVKQNYKDPKTWFKIVEITEVDGVKYYKTETELRYYYLERKPSLDVYSKYAREKDITRNILGKVFAYEYEIQSNITVTLEIKFIDLKTVEYKSTARPQAPNLGIDSQTEYFIQKSTYTKTYKYLCNNNRIEVYKEEMDTKPMDILEPISNKLYEIKKKINFMLR